MNKDSVKPIGLYVAVALVLFVVSAGAITLSKSRNQQVLAPNTQAPVSSPQPIAIVPEEKPAQDVPIISAPAPTTPSQVPAPIISSAPVVSQVPSTGAEDNLLFSVILISVSLYLAFGLRQHRFLYKKLAERA